MPFSSTACVGEIGDIIIGIAFVLPAALIYKKHKNKKGALIGLVVGALVGIAAAMVANWVLLIPFYVKAFGWEAIIGMVAELYPGITQQTFFSYYLFLGVAHRHRDYHLATLPRLDVRVGHRRAQKPRDVLLFAEFQRVHQRERLPFVDKGRDVAPEHAFGVLTPRAVVRLVRDGRSAPQTPVPADEGHLFKTLRAKRIAGVRREFAAAHVAGNVLGIYGTDERVRGSAHKAGKPLFHPLAAPRHQNTSPLHSSSMRLRRREYLLAVSLLRIIFATVFFAPTMTTSFLARVTAV